MDKELFKSLANKVASQDSMNVLIDVVSESDAFSTEEFDNIIALLVGVYNAPVIKEKANSFNTDRIEMTFKSFNKVKMIVHYTYRTERKMLEHGGVLLSKWEAERKGLGEVFELNAVERASDEIHTDRCSYEQWAKYQCGDIVSID